MKNFIILCVLLFGCGSPINHPSPPPVLTDIDYCVKAEERLIMLKCPVAAPTKKGVSFTQFCKDTQMSGVFLNAKCLSVVDTCESVDFCTGSK